jgi:tetratricopeptide (TPR) repeat protein
MHHHHGFVSASPAVATIPPAPARSPWRGHAIAITPALIVVAVALAWAGSHGGFAVTNWYPGAIGLLLVLTALVAGLRPAPRELPRAVALALLALALFTVWSFASIVWADAKGVAWEGANRTLLYFVMFAIPALSRLDARRALIVVGAWTAGIVVLAVWVLVALPGAVGSGPPVLGPGLAAPIGYANAEACLWMMAAWPALVLSSRTALAPPLRGLFAGGAVVLVDVSLLGESSGALIAGAICAVVLLVVLPGRVRTLAGLVPVALGVGLTAPHVLDVSAARADAGAPIGDLASLATPVLGVAVIVAAIVAGLALLELTRPPSAAAAQRARRAVGAAAVAVAIVGAGAVLVATGNPVDSAHERWDAFKLGATVDPATGALAGFGGARYDYYRVAADVIGEHPVRGVGADNFAQDYAARGRALEFPSYVHSIELRTLVHTGAVGALLLALALAAALLAAWRAARTGPVANAAAVAGVMVFAHWFVQGSADWFWEFPALGGAAFAMLGVACAVAPGRDVRARPQAPRRGRSLTAVAGGALVALCCLSLGAPWASAILTERAGRVWTIHEGAAFRQLDVAARLNPLSSRPALTEGTIALRLNRLDRARSAFEQALERDPREAYATLALGAIASQHDRGRALVYLRRAVRLNRQDSVTIGALQTVRAGQPVDIPAMLMAFEKLAADARR